MMTLASVHIHNEKEINFTIQSEQFEITYQ